MFQRLSTFNFFENNWIEKDRWGKVVVLVYLLQVTHIKNHMRQVPQLTETLGWCFCHIKQQSIDCKTRNTGNQVCCDFYILKRVQLLSLHWVPIIAWNVSWMCAVPYGKHGTATKCTSYIPGISIPHVPWLYQPQTSVAALTVYRYLFLPRPCCWSFILRALRSCSV